MPKTTKEKFEQLKDRALKAQERARKKQIEKWNDPKLRDEHFKKQIDRANKARERKIEKLQSKQAESTYHHKIKKRAIGNHSAKKRTTSRGLKGRPPSQYEKHVMDLVGQLPCLPCLLKERHRPLISLHHMDGRTKPFAHAKTLPICAEHHDTVADKEIIRAYPDLIPIHARGQTGGATQWRQHNGCEWWMLAVAYSLVGIAPEFELPEVDEQLLENVKKIYRSFS
ncbi:Ref family recombination enhancement nuclease (plasmid) [Photobacterium sp. CCB-ST2H9]|uniref:Ref family recombination enhancement nuclease n=1 Tax=Photobacterium sp. CCB-ST2H9 TaxID=2912855 RepID=UPI002005C877|nr:Ref family recombination enhancement nuclease [Photobacterium sp. CCB-ST2H9]UTM60429.1 Ref family recombination enhancement nuclease [Photobacterium sp. CCB-ST2H9]